MVCWVHKLHTFDPHAEEIVSYPESTQGSSKEPITRDGSGPGESGYSSKPAPFGPGMDYTYWTVDLYGDTHINPCGDGGRDGLTLTPSPYPPRPALSPLPVK